MHSRFQAGMHEYLHYETGEKEGLHEPLSAILSCLDPRREAKVRESKDVKREVQSHDVMSDIGQL